jgi:hypothetical protein
LLNLISDLFCTTVQWVCDKLETPEFLVVTKQALAHVRMFNIISDDSHGDDSDDGNDDGNDDEFSRAFGIKPLRNLPECGGGSEIIDERPVKRRRSGTVTSQGKKDHADT